MNRKDAPLRSPESEYLEAAILHHQLLDKKDRRGSNAAHDRLIIAIKEIRSRPDRGRSFLLGLITHDDENVRLWSASHLLPLDEGLAVAELTRLGKSANSWLVRSSADVTCTEWQKGTLDVDWFMRE